MKHGWSNGHGPERRGGTVSRTPGAPALIKGMTAPPSHHCTEEIILFGSVDSSAIYRLAPEPDADSCTSSRICFVSALVCSFGATAEV